MEPSDIPKVAPYYDGVVLSSPSARTTRALEEIAV